MDVTLDQDGLRIDGDLWPLVSGEFEYWRHNSLFWDRIFELIKGAGLETVGTFVCWEFHEVEHGRFDFTGETHPSRDLAGWLDACGRHGLRVLLRIGPIHDAEWPSRGPALDVCTKERLDPEFLERTREYVGALASVVRERQITQGGPIVALCLDNEVYFPYVTDDDVEPTAGSIPIPYNEEVVLDGYRKWLESRYGGTDELSEAWGTKVHEWSDVRTPDYATDSSRQTADSFEYIGVAMRRYFSILQDMCRDVGLTLPTFCNTRQFTEYIDWPGIEEVIDSQGVNTYMGALLPDDQGLVINWYYRLQLARRRLFWASEFQAGSTIGVENVFGVLGPDHFRYFNQLAMALGLRGANWYMFVERDDWHWCPINPIGKTRPQYEVMKENIRILKDLVPDQQVGDIGLLWFLGHNQAFMASRFPSWTDLQKIWVELAEPKEFDEWWRSFSILLASDVDFRVVDPRVAPRDDPKMLVYAGPDFADPDEWHWVRDRVAEGAHLVCATALPSRDLGLAPNANVERDSTAIRDSGRLLDCDFDDIPSVALQAGIRPYVTTRPGGLWSTARRAGDRWTVGVVNPATDHVAGVLEISDRVAKSGTRYRLRALVADWEKEVDGEDLRYLPLSLAGKSVELFVIHGSLGSSLAAARY